MKKVRSKSSTTRVVPYDGAAYVFEPGEPVEVPAELAKSLLAQSDRFEQVSTKKAVSDGEEK